MPVEIYLNVSTSNYFKNETSSGFQQIYHKAYHRQGIAIPVRVATFLFSLIAVQTPPASHDSSPWLCVYRNAALFVVRP